MLDNTKTDFFLKHRGKTENTENTEIWVNADILSRRDYVTVENEHPPQPFLSRRDCVTIEKYIIPLG